MVAQQKNISVDIFMLEV